MKLHIAGGCGEHGRNCFHVIGDKVNFLVDCGLMAEDQDCYPRLTPSEIANIEAVFLTHSHTDHTGALPWLYKNGFRGVIIGSENTLHQLTSNPSKYVALESICDPLEMGCYMGIKVKWGKSGHCLGSVWYFFEAEGRSFLFSGDYTENFPVYITDLIRSQMADFAVIDCAYGKSTLDYHECCNVLTGRVKDLLEKFNTVVFPVPKYGRGLDLLSVFLNGNLKTEFFGDAHFLAQLHDIPLHTPWYKSGAKINPGYVQLYSGKKKGIVFASDPQLRGIVPLKMVSEILEFGGIAVMTGTVEKGTNSEALIESGKMISLRYPVHLNFKQYTELKELNSFVETIPYHCAEFECKSR